MLILFSPVISVLFRLVSVLFSVAAVVWKYFLSLPRPYNIKLTLSTMTGEKGTNTTFLEDSFMVALHYWETSRVNVMLLLGANAVTLL